MSTANRFVIALVVGVFVGTFVFAVLPPVLESGLWDGISPYGPFVRVFCKNSDYPCANAFIGKIRDIENAIQCATPLITVLAFALTFFLLPKEKKPPATSS